MKIPPVNTEDLESYPLGQHPFGAKNPSPQEIQAFEKFLNGRDTNGLDFSPSQSGDALRAVEEGFKPRMLTTTADSPALQEALTKTEADFKSQFTAHAESSESFHALLSKAFGNIDVDAAEKIRLQALDGDFSWLPEIEVVSGDPSIRGAYSAEDGTVFINEAVLADPAEALRVFTEEVGHHLETQVRTGDSPGDKGEVFARMFLGEKLDPQTLNALRRENDHGTLTIDGRSVSVVLNSPINAPAAVDGDTGQTSAESQPPDASQPFQEDSLLQRFPSGLTLDFLYPKDQVRSLGDADLDAFALPIYRRDNGAYDGLLVNYGDSATSLNWAFIPSSTLDQGDAETLLRVIFGTRSLGIDNTSWWESKIASGEFLGFGPDVSVIAKDEGQIVNYGDRVWLNGASEALALESTGTIELVNESGNGLVLDKYVAGIGEPVADPLGDFSDGVDPSVPPLSYLDTFNVTVASELGNLSEFLDVPTPSYAFKFAEGVPGSLGGTIEVRLTPIKLADGTWDYKFESLTAGNTYGFFASFKPVAGVSVGAGAKFERTFALDPNDAGGLSITDKAHFGATLDKIAALGIAWVEDVNTGDLGLTFNGTLLGLSGDLTFNSFDLLPTLTALSFTVPFTSVTWDLHQSLFNDPGVQTFPLPPPVDLPITPLP